MEVKSMAERIAILLRAKYTILAVSSKEELRVERLIRRVAEATVEKKTGKPFAVRYWSCTQGFTDEHGEQVDDKREPVEALQRVQAVQERAIYVFRDLHAFFQDPVVLRAIRDTARILKSSPPEVARAVILLSPALTLPSELEADVHAVEWPLPNRDELRAVLTQSIENLPDEALRKEAQKADTERVVSAALGLTAEEAYSAFARSMVETKKMDPALILQEKKQIVAKSGVLEWMDPLPGGLDDVGDLDEAKPWLMQRQKAFSAAARAYGLPTPKGILIVGVSGCGKTELAKAVATAWGVPLIRLNVGRLFAGLVGASEGNLRRAIGAAEVCAPCVLLIDEMDKAVGAGDGGEHDGGTTSRVRGELLTWLQDRTAEVFVVATANNIDSLAARAPELLRKGRWDELFFVDLPSVDGRESIFNVHLRKRGIKGVDAMKLALASPGFSGAEIAAVVTDAMFRSFVDGARPTTIEDIGIEIKRTIPMSKSSEHRITALRQWGKINARPASKAYGKDDASRKIEVA